MKRLNLSQPFAKGKRSFRKMKPLAAPLSLVLALFILLGSTMAWFVATDGKVNPFRAPAYTFAVHTVDEFPNPGKPFAEGGTYEKRVGAANVGDYPAFVRLMIQVTIISADGTTVLPASLGVEVEALDLNTTDWMYGDDGYFYYLHKLNAGVSTTDLGHDLFSTVQIADGLAEDYSAARLKIEVKCEASDIEQWNYRQGWWGAATAPTGAPLSTIDAELAPLAKTMKN